MFLMIEEEIVMRAFHIKFYSFLFFILSIFFFFNGFCVNAEDNLSTSLKFHSDLRPLLINQDTPIESGSLIYKYKDDYSMYMYTENVLDNDWVICVPILEYSGIGEDSYTWKSCIFDLDDIYAKKIKDVCIRKGNKYLLHDENLISLDDDYYFPIGRVNDIILFRCDEDGKVKINGVWRIVWSVRLNEKVDRSENIVDAVKYLKKEMQKYSNVLNISNNKLKNKYSVYKHTDEIFKLLPLAQRINNIYALTADNNLTPNCSIDIPRYNDYMLVKIADFDDKSGKWIPSVKGSSFSDSDFEKNIVENGNYTKDVKYKETPRFWSNRFLNNNIPAIYDIVHKSSDDKCDFAIRVALVGNNVKALKEIPLIEAPANTFELVKRYSIKMDLSKKNSSSLDNSQDANNDDSYSFLFKKTGDRHQLIFWILILFAFIYLILVSKKRTVYKKL